MNEGMPTRYYHMTMKQLLALRGKKILRLIRLEGKKMGYLDQKEHERENALLAKINAEIASRVD